MRKNKDPLELFSALMQSNKHLDEYELGEGILPCTQFVASEPDIPLLLLQNILGSENVVYIDKMALCVRTDKTLRVLKSPAIKEIYFFVHIPDRKFVSYFIDKSNVGIFFEDEIVSPNRIIIGNLTLDAVDFVTKNLAKKCLWKYNKAIAEKLYDVSQGRISVLKFFAKHLQRATNRREVMTQLSNYQTEQKEFIAALLESPINEFSELFESYLQKFGIFPLKIALLDYFKNAFFSELKANYQISEKEVLETSEILGEIGRATDTGSFIDVVYKLYFKIRRT